MSHKFPYDWNLKDGYPAKGIEMHGLKVFGTFICGGGSTMGYKLAGFNHIGGVEIDPLIADIYKTNHKPKYLYNMDIRDFITKKDIPSELFNLDILDGSPPCSTFSMAGSRETAWGKKKKFKEGQKEQTLDDLFFEFIKLADRLKPKVIIAENVKGMIQGNARAYVNEVNKGFDKIGYKVQLFLLNAASMGVPQKRERVFFICQRNDLNFPKLELRFEEKSILFKDIMELNDNQNTISQTEFYLWTKKIYGDKDFGQINIRLNNKQNRFTTKLTYTNETPLTITAGDNTILFDIPRNYNKNEACKIGAYPLDYNFKKVEPRYLIGMSVPPVMTAQIAHQVYLQWFNGSEK
jgi:DNA (cytosine-5)-methyltransferase 1